MDKFRAFIQKTMAEKGLSAWQVQKRSGGKIKDSYIKDIVAGKTKSIGVEKLNALALGLDVDSIELFKLASGEDIVHPSDPWPSQVLHQALGMIIESSELTKIVKALIHSKPAKLKAVKKVLEID